MKKHAQLIVMLTYNDETVENAEEIFEACKNSDARYWGFKEKPLCAERMKNFVDAIKSAGKIPVIEVVAYDEDECLEGAQAAVDCGCEILMGTVFFDSVNEICNANGIKYMPFVGKVTGRPSLLSGDADAMITEAGEYLKKGVYGFDLLGYRYGDGDFDLIKNFVSQINAPVCVAGSVNSFERLDEIKQTSPWGFTIGGAFFDEKFGAGFEYQVNKVCKYIEE